MKAKRHVIHGILAGCAMLMIILDGKTALYSMQEGIQLCFQTIIASLFPFFVLSGIISNSLIGSNIGLLRHLGKLCKLPKGAESLLVVGLLSGYPVGAQLVAQAYNDRSLSLSTARRMLGFCSNAGPAFIFGMLSPVFKEAYTSWVLWGIHIAGALLTGWILPSNAQLDCCIPKNAPIKLTTALQNALRNMATVCGWVVIFRVILGFCSRWFLWLFPIEVQVTLSGVLELSNGSILLCKISQEGLRFILASFMLSFGGLCVMMQTCSVTAQIGLGYYFPGKILQTLLTTTMSMIVQSVLFSADDAFPIPISVLGSLILITSLSIHMIRRKKVVAFGRRLLYNTGS